jgi:hypothetical protein
MVKTIMVQRIPAVFSLSAQTPSTGGQPGGKRVPVQPLRSSSAISFILALFQQVHVVRDFVRSQLDLLCATNGGAVAAQSVPRTILEQLQSFACHGAIRFGDPLDAAQIRDIVRNLASCRVNLEMKVQERRNGATEESNSIQIPFASLSSVVQLPFQCAHGRPSMVPLADLC